MKPERGRSFQFPGVLPSARNRDLMRRLLSEIIECVHERVFPTTPSTSQFVERDAKSAGRTVIPKLDTKDFGSVDVHVSKRIDDWVDGWPRSFSLHILIVGQIAFKGK